MINIKSIRDRFFNAIFQDDRTWVPAQLMFAIAITTGGKMVQERLGLPQWQMLGIVAGMFFVQWMLIRSINLGRHWSHWAPAVVVVAAYILTNWPGPGNHTFVYLYLCLVFLITFLNRPNDREGILVTNTRYLFLVIMLMAVVQKVLTPGYMDGTINAFWLANGGYFKPLYFFSENWQQVVESNHALLNEYYNETLYRTDNIVLQSPIPNLPLWGFLYTLMIVAGEILVPLIFVSKRSQLVRHGALLTMVVIILLTRQETGFLCLLCIIGIANCPAGERRLRAIYLALFGLMQLLFLLEYGYV